MEAASDGCLRQGPHHGNHSHYHELSNQSRTDTNGNTWQHLGNLLV
jgi:hypothetical protein